MTTGYASDTYLSAYLNCATQRLEGTRLLKHALNDGYYDLQGVYPFVPYNESRVVSLDDRCVSVVSVSNPLKPITIPTESTTTLFKQHSVCDLNKYSFDSLPTNCKRILKKSNDFNAINLDPKAFDSNIVHKVYQNLVKRHGIAGVTNYSVRQFKCLLEAPGAVLTATILDNEYLGFNLYYIMNNDAYLHISCQTDKSYELNCNHKLTHESILLFQALGLDRLLLGAVPDGGNEGLKRFKTSYSHYELPNFIAKRVLNPAVYDKLSAGMDDNGFFPLYRRV